MSYEKNIEDIFGLIGFLNAETREAGDELQFKKCPYCDGGRNSRDQWTFSINKEKFVYKCLRGSCGKQGHFVELCRDLGYPLPNTNTVKQYKTLPQGPVTVRDAALAFLKSRGISHDIGIKYEITTVTKDYHNGWIVFPFKDENGVLKYVKYRNPDYKKGITSGSKETSEKGAEPILFGMNHCTPGGTLVITEGQLDSLSVAEAGVPNAVSVPNGKMAFGWITSCWDFLNRFDTIIVFGDWEETGMSLLDQIMARITKPVIKAVRHEDYLGEKDANDILQKYGPEALRTAVMNAERPEVKYLKVLSEVNLVDDDSIPKIKTGIAELDKTVGGLAPGQLVLLSGKRGEGKSTFMSQILANALNDGSRAMVYSGELPDYHFKKWLYQQLAGSVNIKEDDGEFGKTYSIYPSTVERIDNWLGERVVIYDNDYVPSASEELVTISTAIEEAIRRYDVNIVCVDNLMTAMDTVQRQNDLYLAQSNFVGGLKKLAQRYGVVIILVAHPRKSNGVDFDNDDVSGSSDITNKVDIVLNYRRGRPEENADCILSVHKNRLYGRLRAGDNSIGLLYDPASKRIADDNDKLCAMYEWELQPDYNERFEEQNGDLPF